MIRTGMRKILAAAALAALLGGGCSRHEEPSKITDLTVNYMKNPIGIEQNPLFGWRMQEDGRHQQTAYRIVVAASQEQLAAGEYRVYGQEGGFLCVSRWERGQLIPVKNFFGCV